MSYERRLTHEEQIDIWMFITTKTRAGPLFGKTAPAYSKGVGSKRDVRYERLAPLGAILDEINASADLPDLSDRALRTLLKSFRSGPPKRVSAVRQKSGRKWEKRQLHPFVWSC